MYHQTFIPGSEETTPRYFQATAMRGLGEYFETGQQSPQAFHDGSLGEYFETGQQSPQAFHDGSLGALSVFDFASPAGGALKAARLRGLGEDSIAARRDEALSFLAGTAGLAIVAGTLLIGGLLNYQQGKAMAPSADKKKKWGWIAVPVGFLPFGLPIMAIVSNSKQGR